MELIQRQEEATENIIKNEFLISEKTIHFDSSHPQIENLLIQTVNRCGGFDDMNQSFIKWIITYDTNLQKMEISQLFIIDSLTPLRVMTGLAAMEHSYFMGINQKEEEIIKFVNNLSADDLMKLSANAIPIGYNDKLQLFKSAGTPLQLKSGKEYTDMAIDLDSSLLSVNEIFTPKHLISLQLHNKNPYAPVNRYIKKRYGLCSLEELLSIGMCAEDAAEIIEIVTELKEPYA